ncbi:MAG TPA: hypothetical protein PK710_19125 [Polyangiaceae bacterium]|nr:hypothetical protein [Polyangiaceae bacterium]
MALGRSDRLAGGTGPTPIAPSGGASGRQASLALDRRGTRRRLRGPPSRDFNVSAEDRGSLPVRRLKLGVEPWQQSPDIPNCEKAARKGDLLFPQAVIRSVTGVCGYEVGDGQQTAIVRKMADVSAVQNVKAAVFATRALEAASW